MTKLGKPVTRETAVVERGDPLVVELHGKHLVLRIKGKKGSDVDMSYDALYDLMRRRHSRWAK
jgi:hypothetical protein